MTEEIKQDEVVEQKQEVLKETPVVKTGHMSRDEWIEAGKDPDLWVSEKVYEERGKLFESLQAQNKKIKTLDDQINKLAKLYEAADKKGYERGLAELKKQQKEAMELYDLPKVEAITDEIEKLKEEHIKKTVESAKPANTLTVSDTQLVEEFINKNSWYNGSTTEDIDMTIACETFDDKLRAKQPHLSIKEHLQKVQEFMESKYPHRFKSEKPRKIDVEGNSIASVDTGSSNKNLYQKLPADHKRMFDSLKLRIPNISIEQYYADYEYELKKERV